MKIQNKAIDTAIARGVEISYEKYPVATMTVLTALGEVADVADATVKYVDRKTGKVVSTQWNSLSESTQARLKGGADLVGITLAGTAAASVTKAIANSKHVGALARAIVPNEVSNKVVKVGWSKGNMPQGMPWEEYVGKQLNKNTKLPNGFKTFDFFDHTTGIAISAKTLDTLTPSKIKSPKQIYSTLKKHIDAAASF